MPVPARFKIPMPDVSLDREYSRFDVSSGVFDTAETQELKRWWQALQRGCQVIVPYN